MANKRRRCLDSTPQAAVAPPVPVHSSSAAAVLGHSPPRSGVPRALPEAPPSAGESAGPTGLDLLTEALLLLPGSPTVKPSAAPGAAHGAQAAPQGRLRPPAPPPLANGLGPPGQRPSLRRSLSLSDGVPRAPPLHTPAPQPASAPAAPPFAAGAAVGGPELGPGDSLPMAMPHHHPGTILQDAEESSEPEPPPAGVWAKQFLGMGSFHPAEKEQTLGVH